MSLQAERDERYEMASRSLLGVRELAREETGSLALQHLQWGITHTWMGESWMVDGEVLVMVMAMISSHRFPKGLLFLWEH